jgi:hypothetical protein
MPSREVTLSWDRSRKHGNSAKSDFGNHNLGFAAAFGIPEARLDRAQTMTEHLHQIVGLAFSQNLNAAALLFC